ncbi:MAG: HupE/UreJ family protein [Bdellovibrionales bacterium]|nr:HupE/UreJ family protein [Bdellovibrionales bacterium]
MNSLNTSSRKVVALISGIFLLFPLLANAHLGVGSTAGTPAGFFHPFSGLDHLLAMLGVGFWAAQLGGRAIFLIPSSFISVMIFGWVLGISEVPLPFVEHGIILSVLITGIFIAIAVRLPLVACMFIVGFFALFHGYAHGSEMTFNVGFLSYMFGLITATTLLHGVGIFAAKTLGLLKSEKAWRGVGAAITLAGLYLILF